MVGLFAVVLIALVVAGLAYAHWSETLYINGSVSTGELDVAIISATCNDEGIDPGKNKNVVSCAPLKNVDETFTPELTVAFKTDAEREITYLLET